MSRKALGVAAHARRIAALSTASSIALVAAQPAFAQQAGDSGDDEAVAADAAADDNVILVTGFRKSLQDAQNVKRNADTVVDAITAEDIGALPDRSVAEALQRVPGVNIGRFEKSSDPDRFSVEGTGVIVRGLPYVRSELNGREIFSATGGTVLSFNDVSPELLGRVEVYKNLTADMVEGGVAGTVNLVTRKPLDKQGFHIAGTVEANWGDLAEEWSPGYSILVSNTWETPHGTIGAQFGFADSELISRTDASQISDPCYRSSTLTSGCIRALAVGDGGYSGNPLADESNFPPANTVVAPKGAGVRTTTLERDRRAFSGALEWESVTGNIHATLEYLRSDTQFFTDEYALLAQVNSDGLFPIPRAGSTWVFDSNNVFQSGVLTQSSNNGISSPFGGIPLESLRFQRATDAMTEDMSFNVTVDASDRLRFNFEMQYINSDLSRDSIIGAMETWADIAIDNSGSTPQVEFLIPNGAPADYFSSGYYTYYWFLLDSFEKNDGDLWSSHFDGEYDISDEGFLKKARFGARWSDRDRTNRNTNFSTWGNLSAPWTGRGGCAPWGGGPGCYSQPGFIDWSGFTPGRLATPDGTPFANAGGAFTDDFPDASQVRSPFGNGFQRGNAPTPIADGSAWFFGGDDFLGEFLDGTTIQQARAINTFSQTPNSFFGAAGRSYTDPITREVTQCDPYCPPEINTVREETKAAYLRLDYGADFGDRMNLSGNIGVRYVETKIRPGGLLGFPNPFGFDSTTVGGNGDGIVQVSEINRACNTAPPDNIPGYCSLSDARKAEFASKFTGETIRFNEPVRYDHWLPSFNAKLDFGNGLLVRGAVSKAISRPDLSLYNAGGYIGDNTNNLRAQGTLETGPLFIINTGNRAIRPVESWNYDLSLEWYWDDIGSITAAVFVKDLKQIVTSEDPLLTYTSPNGTTIDAITNRVTDSLEGTMKGFEVAYQDVFEFLPGFLDGFGTQLTYTYVDAGDFSNAELGASRSLFAALQPLQGISEHTINAVLFYEKGPLSARAAYNWRSEYLITPRDDIFPFSPIWNEPTGQLDASIFFSVTDKIKLGVQGVNLLDEVTTTTQVIDFDGNRVTRSAFRNDRRFTFLARFDF